jgi:DNA repair protein RadC
MEQTWQSRQYVITLVGEKDTEYLSNRVTMPSDLADYARKLYGADLVAYESCFMLMLNTQHQIVGWYKLGQGSIDGSLVDVRLLTKAALDSLCVKVALVHNHPSGNLTPSVDDKVLTKRVTDCLGLFNIKLLDHIILTEDAYYSFDSEGLLPLND